MSQKIRQRAAGLLRVVDLATGSPRRVGFALGIVLSAAYLALRFGSLTALGESVDHFPGLMVDFSMYFYRTGKSLMAGTGPVGGFLYPPIFGLMMMPLSYVSPARAELLWGIFGALATLALAALSARLAPPRLAWVTLATALTVASAPALHNFKWGQIGVPLTVLGLLGVEWCGARRQVSVMLISLAASIKLYPVVLLSVFARRRDPRALMASAAWGLFLVLGAPILVLGLRRTRKFFQKVAPYLSATADTTDPNSQSLAHWLSRWFDVPARDLALGLAALMGLVAVALLWRSHSLDGSFLDSLALDRFTGFLALAFVPMIIPTSWANYFAFLPPMAAFLASQGDRLPPGPRRLVHVISLAVLMAGSFVMVDLRSGWKPYVAEGILLLANLLAAAGALGILAFWVWRGRSERGSPEVEASTDPSKKGPDCTEMLSA